MPGPGETTAPRAERRNLHARDRAVELISAIPAWAWLTLLIGLSFGIRALLARRDPSPWIFSDELLYSDLAKSFAATGHFAIRDNPGTGGFGIVYPILISPAWALFKNVTLAYTSAKLINSFVMSLSAIPAYLLARRLAGTPAAICAAVLTLALPAMVYTSTIMTENAFLPVFLFWVLAVVAALERPTVLAATRCRRPHLRRLPDPEPGNRASACARHGDRPRRLPGGRRGRPAVAERGA